MAPEDDQPGLPSSLEYVRSKTDANTMFETAEQPEELDLEKAEQSEKKASGLGLMDPSSFPDGGIEAWLVVFGAFLILFCSFGWINCKEWSITGWNSKVNKESNADITIATGIGVFQDYYQTNELSYLSPSTVAWIPSLETFMMFIGVRLLPFGYLHCISLFTRLTSLKKGSHFWKTIRQLRSEISDPVRLLPSRFRPYDDIDFHKSNCPPLFTYNPTTTNVGPITSTTNSSSPKESAPLLALLPSSIPPCLVCLPGSSITAL